MTCDSFDSVMADADEVFSFSKYERPQDRAHAYLARNQVARGYNDTAMQVVVRDLCRRAYEAGADDADGPFGFDDVVTAADRASDALLELSRAIDAASGVGKAD